MESNKNEPIDALLEALPAPKAPEGFRDNVMNQILASKTISTSQGISIEKWMLALILLAGAMYIFFAVDLDFAIKGMTEFVQQLGHLMYQENALEKFAQTSSQLPRMALITLASLGSLLLLERLLLHRLLNRFFSFVI